MPQLPDIQNNIFSEEVSFKRPVSEGTFQKMGSAVNFINNRRYETHQFILNGNIGGGSGSSDLDGRFIPLFNSRIIGFSFYRRTVNTLDPTATNINLVKYNTDNSVAGSIFDGGIGISLPPSGFGLPAQAGVYQYDDSGVQTGGSGFGGGEFSIYNLDDANNEILFGESLGFDLISVTSGSIDLIVTVYFKPI